ncbi:hypothetical protein F610DRAFT_01374 [Streptomyces sp. LaPpAH-199]|uniref:hypothetical protein n=1 Tax=Streptomyces TaxID=1883 RepID=UPI00088204E4|nr:hypothetical protein [Streptomyces sp. LaPpAH-199]MYW82023.1 hypothetical protein [Streptomyces sp. SID8369]SDC24363.1 hypothetical protein F610DRAFT_01374 [Streptomyces sp. LaPpAH-199]
MLIVTYGGDGNSPLTYFIPTLMAGGVTPPGETVSAQDYLTYAKEDLKCEGNRATINAFGNAKRSIHKLVDDLIFQYGLSTYCRRLPFPQKLGVLSDLELVSPYVLSALNVERNAVEHDYVAPTLTRTREAVDVAELLLMAMSGFHGGVPYEGFCSLRQQRKHVLLRLNPWECTLTFHKYLRPEGTRFRTHAGVRTYWHQVRDTAYQYLLEVTETPWRSIPIIKQEKDSWLPILQDFVQIQKSNKFDMPFVSMALDERFYEFFKNDLVESRNVKQLDRAQGFRRDEG